MSPNDHDKIVRFSLVSKIIGGSVGLFLIIMLTITIAVVTGTIEAESRQNEKLAKIPVIEEGLGSMKEDIKKLTRDVEKIRQEMQRQINRDDLNRLIESIKNGKK